MRRFLLLAALERPLGLDAARAWERQRSEAGTNMVDIIGSSKSEEYAFQPGWPVISVSMPCQPRTGSMDDGRNLRKKKPAPAWARRETP